MDSRSDVGVYEEVTRQASGVQVSTSKELLDCARRQRTRRSLPITATRKFWWHARVIIILIVTAVVLHTMQKTMIEHKVERN